MGHKLIDSHIHILDPRLRERADSIVANLAADGLECVVEISADPVEAHEAAAFAAAHEGVYCAIGVHPIFANTYSEEFEEWAFSQRGNKKIVAIGECGLDYFHMECPKETQRDVFVRQIKLAQKLGLPLVIHAREAFDDTFEILTNNRKYLTNGILLHCFSGGAEEVERFKSFDTYFAFGGAITYKNAHLAAGPIRAVPRDRMMIETDCPYLAPVPLRGSVNEPKNV